MKHLEIDASRFALETANDLEIRSLSNRLQMRAEKTNGPGQRIFDSLLGVVPSSALQHSPRIGDFPENKCPGHLETPFRIIGNPVLRPPEQDIASHSSLYTRQKPAGFRKQTDCHTSLATEP